MVVKTFRGLLADGGQERIRLSTMKGKVGYKIVKFQVIGDLPGAQGMEHVVKIYKSKQSTIDGTVNFSDNTLLGVAYIQDHDNVAYPTSMDVIFDREMVNQDIYITQVDTDTARACNYYLELEVIPLDDKSAEYTTVKDLRTRGF